MNTILVSRNGNYILAENNLYSIIEDKTYSLNEMSFEQYAGFLMENSSYLYKNKLMESVEIISQYRKLVYQICEHFKPDHRTSTIMEFEAKFGNLITENTLIFENWLSTAYNWTIGALIDHVKSYGPAFIKLAKDLMSFNIKAIMEDLRAILFSPEGMGLEAALAATGIGGAVPMVLWGLMLAYDVYLKITNDPESNWFNIIIDAIACAGAGATVYLGKLFRETLQFTGLFQKAAGKGVEEVVEVAVKNPKVGPMLKNLGEKISKQMPSITSNLRAGAEWAAKKLKVNWLTKAVDGFAEMMAKFLDKLGVKASKKVTQKFARNTSGRFQNQQLRNIAAMKQGLKTGFKQTAIAGTIMKGAETKTGQNLINKGLSFIGQNPYDDILKAGGQVGVDLGPAIE